jgi:septum formation protein
VTTPVVLASASPRRHELLARLGIVHVQRPAHIDESPLAGEDALEHAVRLAHDKARAAAAGLSEGVVLGSDTVVVLDGSILGKPASKDEAASHLRRLRGRRHHVITAVAVVEAGTERSWRGHEITDVWIREFTDDEMWRYIDSEDPLDKAGAYAIQNEEFRPVASIAGSRTNVVGLPLGLAARLLAEAGVSVEPLEDPTG